MAEALHRRIRVRGAEPVPDRTAELLAVTAPLAPRADRNGARTAQRSQSWARYGLLWVALVQLVLAVPALFLGADHGASLHVAHEIGAWDAALAIAMLTVAFQPRRAAGLLPFVGSLTVVLLLTAAIDVAGGHTPVVGETGHLLTLAGVVLLWIVARSRPDPRPLIRFTHQPTT
ncbi:MAG TPA: hypothetical protein VHA73_14295 [Acidimicrobiales bacterium]|nr:hypothetical protein [Acidimicrobiales bacterium]